MMPLKKKRRIQIIALAAASLLLSTGLIGYAMRDGINYFRSPSQLLAEPPSAAEVFRLGGLVKDGSIKPDEGVHFFFTVTDGGAEIPVHYVGDNLKPDLFDEGQGTVATGRFVDGTFEATEILAKHDESYMPKEVIDALKDQGVYVEPGADGATHGAPVTN
ncbi:cytochrome c maturation protein CcmE [Rubellimicrobium arenae]|uniref:cytochrome c maturation protein CcmE n=1 Tax=Rubellimicrobium arenae TaxID=2817372 RepID=UPI001B302411|nr:cytochrome c maturation protein CcmE [Rubellimicrobium arenae]